MRMRLRPLTISRFQAAHLAAVIADRLTSQPLEPALEALTASLLQAPLGKPAWENYAADIVNLCGEEYAREVARGILNTCYPIDLAPREPLVDARVTGSKGAGIGDVWTGYNIGKEIARRSEESGFNDWWWENNWYLDESFFNWLDSLGAESFPPGDYPPPDSGSSYG
jgi:hypothetical protein